MGSEQFNEIFKWHVVSKKNGKRVIGKQINAWASLWGQPNVKFLYRTADWRVKESRLLFFGEWFVWTLERACLFGGQDFGFVSLLFVDWCSHEMGTAVRAGQPVQACSSNESRVHLKHEIPAGVELYPVKFLCFKYILTVKANRSEKQMQILFYQFLWELNGFLALIRLLESGSKVYILGQTWMRCTAEERLLLSGTSNENFVGDEVDVSTVPTNECILLTCPSHTPHTI